MYIKVLHKELIFTTYLYFTYNTVMYYYYIIIQFKNFNVSQYINT